MPIQDQVGFAPGNRRRARGDASRSDQLRFPWRVAPRRGQRGVAWAAVKAGTNLLHFARCAKLEKASDEEAKIWFKTIAIAKTHLDEAVGPNRWKWCKVCEREITQKILNER